MADHIHDATGRVNRRGNVILSICIACGVIQTFAVALRFLARRQIKARLQVDDWFIFGSLWPNYAMIIAGGFREAPPIKQAVRVLTLYQVVGEGKAGMSIAYLSHHQKAVFLQVRVLDTLSLASC